MKILRLTYGEILKQIKKRSFKICLVILLCLAILIPILYKIFVYGAYDNSIYNKDTLAFYENQIIDEPSSDEDKIRNDLNRVMINTIKKSFIYEKGKSGSSFKLDLYEQYSSLKMELVCIDYIEKNKNVDYGMIDEEFALGCSDLKNRQNFDDVKMQADLKLSEYEDVLRNGDYTYYLNSQIEFLKSSGESLADEKIKVYEKLIELNVTLENDFRALEGEKIISNLDLKEDVLSERVYAQQDINIQYNDYLKLVKLKNKEIDDDIKISWYSIINNTNHDKDGIKDFFNDSIENNIIFLSIFVIIIAGGIVSNEFSKGTVRLLMIRPNERWKILLSKFLTIIFLTFALSMFMYMASFITSGILFNFDNLLVSDLMVKSSKVVEVNYIFLTLYRMFILLIPTIFIGLIAFFMSTVTKNTALSVGISIFVLVGSSVIFALLSMFKIPCLDLTFLPYLNYSKFLSSSSLIDSCYMYNMYYTLVKANIVLLIWGIVIYFMGNLMFIKRDIKN